MDRRGYIPTVSLFTLMFLIISPFISIVVGMDQPTKEEYRVSECEFTIIMTSGPEITVTVFYPGYRGPLERYLRDQDAPFPVIVFSPGYGGSATDYRSFLENLASCGFVVAGASWSYESDREEDTAHVDHTKVLDRLEQYNDDRNSPLYGLVDTGSCGAFGHSRGARAAFMASGVDERIRNIAAWMPTLNNGSGIDQNANKLLFGGDNDDIASPEEWLDPLYYSSGEPFIYVTVFNGDHQPTEDIHMDITLKFFRYHLLDETYLESDVYGYDIRQRAESGEFHLRIINDGEVYDSHPHLSIIPVAEGEEEKDVKDSNDSPNLGFDALLIILFTFMILMWFKSKIRRFERKYYKFKI
ncbi:MAG: hypothetical protein JXA22_06205 [Candidatus Thermoplasmatota archaeon]|nr:hypothetical protein [Candidatus Thermoplasmatota archaeon]